MNSLLIVGIWCILQFYCNAEIQVADDESTACDEMGNCTTCIREYADLESYILSNKVVLSRIVETFFKTGKAPSSFVKITYDFQVSDNSTDNITDVMNDNTLNCTKHQEVYFWSSSPLYLLGPSPLMYSTLFAVFISEESVTISLPCLCKDIHGALLSRLTYLVKKMHTSIHAYYI